MRPSARGSEPLASFTREDILRLFEALNAELARMGIRGDLNLAGGAVMCLAFRARNSTRDVDAEFVPAKEIREASVRVSKREGVTDHWLNDAVKSYLSDRGTFEPFLERSHLRVFCADARYMLAMKVQAMRVGEGYRDEEDVRYLLRNLGIESYAAAESILADYYALGSYRREALSALRELIESAAK